MKVPSKLQKLYDKIDECERCKAEGNSLRHIHGGGKFKNPKFFFLFINPTHKNRSTSVEYAGRRRYPFIGVRHLYKGLSEAGFIDPKIISDIYASGWQTSDETRIETSLREHDVYISNFVKCAQPNPKNPRRSVMKADLPLLAEELSIVAPQYVITFGRLPLEVLSGKSYKMRDILEALERRKYEPVLSRELSGRQYRILPCFYPLGHGNPPKAHKILSHIAKTFS